LPDERRHESEDLRDYSVQEPADSLAGGPGDNPLDRGVAPPERWSAAIRYGTTADEQEEGESLDQQLAEEEPDPALEGVTEEFAGEPGDSSDSDTSDSDTSGSGASGSDSYDEDEADEYVDGLLLDDGPDPRAGRLVAEDEGAHPDTEDELVARDVGIDDGAATAEEAAMHVVEDDDNDVRSELGDSVLIEEGLRCRGPLTGPDELTRRCWVTSVI
jgi:hypothetical protein